MTDHMRRIAREMEEASYGDKNVAYSGYTPRNNPDLQRESVGGQAIMAICKQDRPDIKWDFELVTKTNDRWTTMFNNAEANQR